MGLAAPQGVCQAEDVRLAQEEDGDRGAVSGEGIREDAERGPLEQTPTNGPVVEDGVQAAHHPAPPHAHSSGAYRGQLRERGQDHPVHGPMSHV